MCSGCDRATRSRFAEPGRALGLVSSNWFGHRCSKGSMSVVCDCMARMAAAGTDTTSLSPAVMW
jgi:hypothetical protein